MCHRRSDYSHAQALNSFRTNHELLLRTVPPSSSVSDNFFTNQCRTASPLPWSYCVDKVSIAATAFSHAKRSIVSSLYHFTWGVGVIGLFLWLGVTASGYSMLASASFWIHLLLKAVERSSAFCMIPWGSDICSRWIRERWHCNKSSGIMKQRIVLNHILH